MLNITHCSLFTVCSGKFISSLEALHVLVNCSIIFWRLLCWASIWNVRLWVLGVQRVKTIRKPNNIDPSQPYPVKNEYFLDHTDLKFFTWQFLNRLIPHTRENYFHTITVYQSGLQPFLDTWWRHQYGCRCGTSRKLIHYFIRALATLFPSHIPWNLAKLQKISNYTQQANNWWRSRWQDRKIQMKSRAEVPVAKGSIGE